MSNMAPLLTPEVFGIYSWAICSNEFDLLLGTGYKNSNGKEYISPPPYSMQPINISARINFYMYYDRNLPLMNLIHIIFLDTSFVSIYAALNLLKAQSYSLPTRQHFESHKNLGLSWDDFISFTKLHHFISLPQGGSRPQTDKIIATREACNTIINKKIVGIVPKNSLSKENFLTMTEKHMGDEQQNSLFHKSEASKIFKNDEKLIPYKKLLGRPKQTIS